MDLSYRGTLGGPPPVAGWEATGSLFPRRCRRHYRRCESWKRRRPGWHRPPDQACDARSSRSITCPSLATLVLK